VKKEESVPAKMFAGTLFFTEENGGGIFHCAARTFSEQIRRSRGAIWLSSMIKSVEFADKQKKRSRIKTAFAARKLPHRDASLAVPSPLKGGELY